MATGAPVVRVLVADDAAGLRDLMVLVLDMEDDFQVVAQAGDGRQALHEAERTRPDLVLLDLAMPVMDGLQALTELRSLLPESKIVVLSGFEATALAEQAIRQGADAYVEKGLGIQQIVEQLRAVCRG